MKQKISKLILGIPMLCGTVMPCMCFTSCSKTTSFGYVDVASYCDSTGHEDCADIIQRLINMNPNRTLYFRDGTYLLSHQIATSSDAHKAVSLKLSNYACLKATKNYQAKRRSSPQPWQDEYLYMVSLGGLDRTDDILTPCASTSLTGGIIDCNGVTDCCGVEISYGREMKITNIQIKGAWIGMFIAGNTEYTYSSDANIDNISIFNNSKPGNIGMKIEGYDNFISNVRTSESFTGLLIKSSANYFHHLHPNGPHWYFDPESEAFKTSKGIEIAQGKQNYFSQCYIDNAYTGMYLHDQAIALCDELRIFGMVHTAIYAEKWFKTIISDLCVSFTKDYWGKTCHMLENADYGGEHKEEEGYINNVFWSQNGDVWDDVSDEKIKQANKGVFVEL